MTAVNFRIKESSMIQAELPDRIQHGFLKVDELPNMQLGKVRCYQIHAFHTGFTLFNPDEQTNIYVQMYQTPDWAWFQRKAADGRTGAVMRYVKVQALGTLTPALSQRERENDSFGSDDEFPRTLAACRDVDYFCSLSAG
jgi:hypothetical protein